MHSFESRTASKKNYRMIAETKMHKEDGKQLSGMLSSGSSSTAILALAKASLGAAILALPQKTMLSGIPVFLLLLTVGGYFTAQSLEMIAKGARYTNKFVFEEIAEVLLGRGMAITLGISMLLNCYGASIVFVIAIKGSLEALLSEVVKQTGNDWPLYATLILGGLVLVPFSIAERINSLRILSLAGVVGVFFTVASVIYALANLGVSPDVSEGISVLEPQGGFVDLMNAMSTVTFAFCNQFNFPQVYDELADKSTSTVRYVAYVSTLLPMSLYILTAVTGYLCYGFGIQSNILENFSPLIQSGTVLIYIGTIAVAWSVSMCHLLNNFPMRLSVAYFLPESQRNAGWVRYAVPLFTAVSTISIAILYSDLSLFLDLVGASTCSIICYIVPAMFSIRVKALAIQASDEPAASGTEKPVQSYYNTLTANLVEWFMMFVGVVIGVVGTFCAFYGCLNS